MTFSTIIASIALALTPAHVPSVDSLFNNVGVISGTHDAAYQNISNKLCYKHGMLYGHGVVKQIDCKTVVLNKNTVLLK